MSVQQADAVAVPAIVGDTPSPLAAQIFAAANSARKREAVVFCGVPVEAVEMDVESRVFIMETCFAKKGPGGRGTAPIFAKFIPTVLIRSLMQPGTDTPVFHEGQARQILALPNGQTQPVLDVCLRISGLSDKAQKELEGNFDMEEPDDSYGKPAEN